MVLMLSFMYNASNIPHYHLCKHQNSKKAGTLNIMKKRVTAFGATGNQHSAHLKETLI